jgi:antitoxin (DNA-binding transcriptional repressor) of toxin-antitoxin stability system
MERVSGGEEVLITYRGKPRIRLSPATEPPAPSGDGLASLPDHGAVATSPPVSRSLSWPPPAPRADRALRRRG